MIKESGIVESETRTVHDPFLNVDVEVSARLIDRLNGKYACGPTMPNGEPEFGYREFDVPPIQKEAARALQKAATLIAELQAGQCDGCGSSRTDEQCRNEQKSCCPDRKMLDITAWRTRALAAESSLHRVRETAIEVRSIIEKMECECDGYHGHTCSRCWAIRSLNITGLDTGAGKTGAMG